MPRRNIAVPPLTHLCLENILTVMDTLWCKDFLDHFMNQVHCLHVVGPFDTLPPRLAHDLFVRLKERKALRKHHVYLLVNAAYETLDCSRETNELSLILQLASVRCSSLKHLDLSRCPRISKPAFTSNFHAFVRLQSLNLSQSPVDDSFLAVIGVYCENLTSLDLSDTKISDRGVGYLLKPVNESGKGDERFGRCLRLQRLNILHTGVTDDGARVALETLAKSLVEFGFENTAEVVFGLLLDNPEVKFQISSLSSSNTDLSDEMLLAAVNACPRARCFRFATYHEMTHSSLSCLAERSADMIELHVTNVSGANCVSAEMCVLPALISSGSNLVSLTLAGISDLGLEDIVLACHSLASLCLEFNVSYLRSRSTGGKGSPPAALAHLRKLRILCSDLDPDAPNCTIFPDGSSMLTLLRSPQLSKLELSRCERLSDEVILQAHKEHAFGKLQTLVLDHCHSVTFNGLSPTLIGDNPLSSVQLTDCRNITLADIEGYKKRLRQMNLLDQVNVKWS